MPIVTTVSNRTALPWFGLATASGVSRIRSGARHPSIRVMRNLEEELGYTIQQQADDLENGQFLEHLEERLLRRARIDANLPHPR